MFEGTTVFIILDFAFNRGSNGTPVELVEVAGNIFAFFLQRVQILVTCVKLRLEILRWIHYFFSLGTHFIVKTKILVDIIMKNPFLRRLILRIAINLLLYLRLFFKDIFFLVKLLITKFGFK